MERVLTNPDKLLCCKIGCYTAQPSRPASSREERSRPFSTPFWLWSLGQSLQPTSSRTRCSMLRLHGCCVVLTLLLGGLPTNAAIEAECSACEAVAAELQRRLDAETPRTHLDMRHRLDKDGNRYGKVINYKVSELRAVNLLDDLCSVMEQYTIITQEPGHSSSSGNNKNGSSDTDSSDAANSGSKHQAGGSCSRKQLVWVKHKGEGSIKVAKNQRPDKNEEEMRVKQLQSFCGLMLEDHEDAVVEALTSDEFYNQGVAPVLCQQITSKCKGKQYPKPPGTSVESSDEEQSNTEMRELAQF
eukprot:GHRR01005507.1.p1 GENE.GHRR01005507.1~~GHRR01005507.1.p1  ORF type:complete len:301 (+),score=79.80 GHRR01005507.1:153-1055(+)